MGVTVTVGSESVRIDIDGLDAVMSFKRTLAIPLADVDRAYVGSIADLKRQLGWRLGGGYWPGLFATGHYSVRGRKGARQLWCVYRDADALVIDTTRDRPWRVVLQHPDREALARQIDAAARAVT